MYRDTSNKIAYSRVTVQPASEPIILTDAKEFLKVSGSLEDTTITRNIIAARQFVERETGLSLITQEREIAFDYFPCEIFLSNGPVQVVNSIKYRDANDVEQPLDTDQYWVDIHSSIPRIVAKSSWPTTKDRPNAVIVNYDAGYGDADDVPSQFIEAICVVLGWMHSNRDQPVPLGLIDHLIGTHVVIQDVTY